VKIGAAILRAINRGAFWVFLRAATRGEIQGINVYLPYRSRMSNDQAKANISAALSCIARYAPTRLFRVQRYLRGIVVGWPQPGATTAHYRFDARMCILDGDFTLHPKHPVLLALTILHEATHARLHSCPYTTPEDRVRIERICVTTEILLINRLPGSQALSRRWESRLASLSEAEYTNEAMIRQA
jgi:hypothetical protein